MEALVLYAGLLGALNEVETQPTDLVPFPSAETTAAVLAAIDWRLVALRVEQAGDPTDPAWWGEAIEDLQAVQAVWERLAICQRHRERRRDYHQRTLRRALSSDAYRDGMMPSPYPQPRRLWAPWLR